MMKGQAFPLTWMTPLKSPGLFDLVVHFKVDFEVDATGLNSKVKCEIEDVFKAKVDFEVDVDFEVPP